MAHISSACHAMVPPTLPLDVLYAIATFSGPHEVTVLMRTCRFLYHEGAKILLWRGPWLDGPKTLASFVKFMDAEELSRCQHLRSLSIVGFWEPGTLVDGAGQALAGLLGANSFQSLTCLYLSRAEVVFQHTQDLIAAFAKLPSLKAITLVGCGDLSTAFLRALKSKLTFVELVYVTNFDLGTPARSDLHPLVALQNVRETLRKLHMAELTSFLGHTLSLQPYPNLEVLVIERTDCPVLGPYISSCPHVKKLHVFTYSCEFDDEENLEDLVNFRTSISITKHNTVIGGVHDIYITGLSCPIEELSMNLGVRDGFYAVIPILLVAEVYSLTLTTAKPHVFDTDGGLPLVLRALPEASPDLEDLNLTIQISRTNEELHSALKRILVPIAHLQICTFALTLDLEETPDLLGSPMDRFLSEFDFQQCARDVLSASATLEEVEIRMLAHPSRGTVTAHAVRG
ncbi:hypothetical protein C8T65DRAFT_724568 [Cerioporus squamosus]|nr:hypothetical protein C8T65DRAFT_724568 [Cerioporus squamosus]